MSDDSPLTVIYLAGWGRSGSTVIGSLLGQMPGAAYVGELWNLWEDAFARDERCGCMSRYSECPFWQRVLAGSGIDRQLGLRLYGLKAEHLGSRSIIFGRARLRRSVQAGPMSEYVRATERLLKALASELGVSTIIDASKTPNLLEVYTRMDGVSTKVLHVVRDPRAVAYSWDRRTKQLTPAEDSAAMARHSPLRSTLSWLARNRLVASGAAELGLPCHRLRYEDFVTRPSQELATALTRWGSGPVPGVTFDGTANSHSVRGNPVRFQSTPLKILADDAWKENMTIAKKLLVTAVSWSQLKSYGYPSFPTLDK